MRKVFACVLAMTIVMAMTPVSNAAEVNVLVWDDTHTESVETQIADFEEATGITVNFERIATRSIVEKMAVAVTAESSDYDLVSIDEPYVAMFAELMSSYEEWPEGQTFEKVGLDEVMPKAFEAGVWDGQNKGLPINGNVYVWMTRRDLIEDPAHQEAFKEAYGYDLGVPETLDQLVDMGTYFKENTDVYGFGPFTKKSEGATCEAMSYFRAYGTQVLDRKEGDYEVVLDKDKAVQAMNMYKTLLDIAPPGGADWHHAERTAAFSLGQVFAMFQWPSIIPSNENAEESMVAGKIIYGAPPAGPAGPAPVRGCWILSIPKAAQNKAAAAEFAYWWGSYESGKKLVEAGMTPVRIDLLQDPELLETRPWFKGIFESMKHAINRPRFDHYTEISDIVQINWMAAVTGAMEPGEAADKIIEDCNKVLEKYGY
jgi:multiple sugar transport system substrate-binding protein